MRFLKSTARWQNQVLALATAMLLFSCSHLEPFQMESEDVLQSVSSSGPSVDAVPVSGANKGGNVECSELDYSHEETSGRIDYEDGEFQGEFPEGFTVKVVKGKLEWSFEPYKDDEGVLQCLANLSIIVKGGPSANAYFYVGGETSDNGLIAPLNKGGKVAGISNVTLCYDLTPCEVEEDDKCYKKETAWADGSKYGVNWATYTAYQTKDPVTIYAGQHYAIGTASFSKVVNGKVTITINLTAGKFWDVKENLKIHGYNSTPVWNQPSLGQFKYKSTESGFTASVIVDPAKFYGIHLDAGREIKCKK